MTGRPELRVFDEGDVRAAVSPADALSAVERAFRALQRGEATLPPPVGMEVGSELVTGRVKGEVHLKGAHLHGLGTFAFKVATGFYENRERGLPVGSGAFLVFDAATGFPLALLRDQGWLTEMRTGAAGALAARLLTPERPLRVGVLGAGGQARFQLRALAGVRPVDRVRIWSRRPGSVEALAGEIARDLGLEAGPVGTPEEAVRTADLVLTVTPSREPLVEAGWLEAGATVVAVGSDGPGKQELASGVVLDADRVVVDRREQSVALGELQRPVREHGFDPAEAVELGAVLTGEAAGRRSAEERIVCDLTGVGVQDAAIADAAWSRLASR